MSAFPPYDHNPNDPLQPFASRPYGAPPPLDEDTAPFLVPNSDPTIGDGGATNGATQPTADEAFAELTLAEALVMLRAAPVRTLRAIVQIARSKPQDETGYSSNVGAALTPSSVRVLPRSAEASAPVTLDITNPDAPETEPQVANRLREAAQLLVRLFAVLVAWAGGMMFDRVPIRDEANALAVGLPFLIVGFMLWLLSESFPLWWRTPDDASRKRKADVPREAPLTITGADAATRIVLVILGSVTVGLSWVLNSGNLFTTGGVIAWLISIAAWTAALMPVGWNFLSVFRRASVRFRHQMRPGWTLFVLALIIVLAAYFRLHDFSGTPPEMTSDHVEKLLDAQRVLDGETNVFFANNGGRESAQMYLLAVLSQLPGLDLNHDLLKLASVIEGLISIPLLWWMGREVIGKDDRRLGNILGLALAALVAASYWHTSLSRLGLRIILTVAVTALLMIYLARAMRYNRREDFVKAGLALGFGLYTYQAVRMLPVIVVLGIGFAFLFRATTARQRARYVVNLAALVLISFVIFVPMARYVYEYPEDFMRRTSGRLFGDDVMQETNENGDIVSRNPTVQERIDAFNANVPTLLGNFRNALLMFNWKGDIAWINGAPHRPQMDAITGGLFFVGLAAWLSLIARRRDMVFVLVPVALLIMLLPSALSIAYPIENPSATRTSGALPFAYLIAALPLALMARSLMRLIGGVLGGAITFAIVAGVISMSYVANAHTYFTEFRNSYLISSLPYSEAGDRLREFAQGRGSYGNAFMIGYPYWWDHRAIGMEAGITDWPNGILSYERVPEFLMLSAQRVGDYPLDPDKPILFFYSPDDVGAHSSLRVWFPEGGGDLIRSYQPEDRYGVYEVPALGRERFDQWVQTFYNPQASDEVQR